MRLGLGLRIGTVALAGEEVAANLFDSNGDRLFDSNGDRLFVITRV